MAEQPLIDSTVAHSARVCDYWLGGKDHYPADREVGEHILATTPEIAEVARADRAFLQRAVTHMADREGIRQFLDIGTGLPTANNTHEVAQAVAPDSRVVYVDNDPMVLAHARALLTGVEAGSTHYIDADLAYPDVLLEQARQHLDFDEPIGLTILGTMGHFPDDAQAYGLVRGYLDALSPGSLFALCDSTDTSEAIVEAARHWNANAAQPMHLRSPEQITEFFQGWELLEPGVVSVPFWRPEPVEVGQVHEVAQFGGVARKP